MSLSQKHTLTKKSNTKKNGRKKHAIQNPNLMTSPGTIAYVGPEISMKTEIRKIIFNESIYSNLVLKSVQELFPSTLNPSLISWIDVNGIHETKLVEKLGQRFGLHPLLLEDIVNTEQKPKIESFEGKHIFLTFKMIHVDDSEHINIYKEHISFIIGPRFLLSFQEELTSDIFQTVLNRLEASIGKTRKNGSDYLLFALMDVVIDNYFIVLEKLGSSLDTIEDSILSNNNDLSLRDLYSLKGELINVRRVIWPLREMINQLIREENPLIKKETIPYFRDLYDHIIQITDTIDSYRDVLASLADVHLSTISNRMNSVMKTLTIFSAIFMPITFIVGVYGMNFVNMPELQDPNGYWYTWALMGITTLGMLTYFRRKKWI